MDRSKNIEFHIKSRDLFGTYATLLDLTIQSLKKSGEIDHDALDSLIMIKEDMLYLNKKYELDK
jgi:hypothetical protein